MQFPFIEIIFNLHPPIREVCAIKLFYSRRLSCFLCHCSHSNLTLSSDTSCRELTRNSQPVRNKKKKKNRGNTHQRKQSHAQDNIYVVQQFAYVHGVAVISLLLGKYTKCSSTVFPLSQKQQQQTLITKVTFSTSCAQASAPWTKSQKIPH